MINRASTPLDHLVVSGSGFSQPLGSLAPGAQTRTGVSPSGESGLKIVFDAAGRHFTASPGCYFENSPGYRVTVTVAPDYSVTTDVRIKVS